MVSRLSRFVSVRADTALSLNGTVPWFDWLVSVYHSLPSSLAITKPRLVAYAAVSGFMDLSCKQWGEIEPWAWQDPGECHSLRVCSYASSERMRAA